MPLAGHNPDHMSLIEGGVSRLEAVMPVKGLQLLPFVVVVLLTGPAASDEAPRRMIGGEIDLRSAVLSPKPFGPPSQFEPRTSATADPSKPAVAKSEPANDKPRSGAAKSETAASEAAKPAAAKPESAKSDIAKSDIAKSESAKSEGAAKSKARAPRKTVDRKPRQKPAVATRKPRTNPLDSYARDDRRQVWPCRGGGGICNWIQPR